MKRPILLVFVALLVSSCASMFNDSRMSIVANPSNGEDGIKVEVITAEGAYFTKLPATIVTEPSNEGIKIRVVDKCYDPTEKEVEKSITGSYWVNILNYGIGFLIDWGTGAMWEYPKSTQVIVNQKQECMDKIGAR